MFNRIARPLPVRFFPRLRTQIPLPNLPAKRGCPGGRGCERRRSPEDGSRRSASASEIATTSVVSHRTLDQLWELLRGAPSFNAQSTGLSIFVVARILLGVFIHMNRGLGA